MAEVKYSFPISPAVEIMQILEELQLPVPEDLLTAPSQETVKLVYTGLYELLTGNSPEEVEAQQHEAMEHLGNRELHEESVTALCFARNLQKLMAAVGVHDFSMKDVYNPDTKRTVRNLSAIINLLRFREDHLDKFTELSENSETLQEQRTEALDENTAHQRQLAELRADQEEIASRSEEIAAECETLTSEVTALNKHQAALGTEIKDLKAEANEINDKIANDRFLIHGAKQEREKLKSQIVQSPEKIKKQLQDMSAAVTGERQNVAGQESQLKDVRGRLDSLQRLNKDIKKNLALVEELDGQAEKVKSSKAVLKQTTANVETTGEKLRALSNKDKSVQNQLTATQKKMGSVSTDGEAALHDAQLRLTKLEKERVNLERSQTHNKARLDQNEAVCREARENIERMRKEHDKDVAGMQALCGRLESQVSSYHEALERRMTAATATGGA